LFLTNVVYTVSAAVPADGPSAKYLYHSGGPLDFLFAAGNYLLLLGIVLLPLGRPLSHAQHDAPSQAGGQPAAPDPQRSTVVAAPRQPPGDFVPPAVRPGAANRATMPACEGGSPEARDTLGAR